MKWWVCSSNPAFLVQESISILITTLFMIIKTICAVPVTCIEFCSVLGKSVFLYSGLNFLPSLINYIFFLLKISICYLIKMSYPSSSMTWSPLGPGWSFRLVCQEEIITRCSTKRFSRWGKVADPEKEMWRFFNSVTLLVKILQAFHFVLLTLMGTWEGSHNILMINMFVSTFLEKI